MSEYLGSRVNQREIDSQFEEPESYTVSGQKEKFKSWDVVTFMNGHKDEALQLANEFRRENYLLVIVEADYTNGRTQKIEED